MDLLGAVCLRANCSGKRLFFIALRQRSGRILTRTFLREAKGAASARERIARGSRLSADEAAHWDLLEPACDVRRINHSDAYSRDGIHINLAESFLSRLWRIVGGQHHRVGRYLGAYAVHAAWFEGHRSESNGAFADWVIGAALA